MNALYKATVQLGLDASVTQFTASDSAVPFHQRARGADHAWGNNQIVVGGGVVGKKTYGTYSRPHAITGSPYGASDTAPADSSPPPRWTKMAATLAKWFGVSAGNMTRFCRI